jgi:transposase
VFELIGSRTGAAGVTDLLFRVITSSMLRGNSPLAHGLIRASFVPPALIQELRDLTRTRTQLTRELARHVQRIQKTLEDANIKLVSAISDIVGMSGRRILKAMIAGETNATRLSELGSPRLKCSRSDLAVALDGRVTAHHRFLTDHHLGLIEELERRIAAFDARIEEVLAPFRDTVERLITTPGVGRGAAEVILAEIGPDMSPFPTAGHLLSWAGVVPRLDESAGKRRSTRVRHGAPWLKPVLVQCAWGAALAKRTYLQAQFFRLKARRGPKKAAIAVAASILTAVYHMLKDGTFYQDLGADYLVKRDAARTVAKLAGRIKDLGFDVQYRATA